MDRLAPPAPTRKRDVDRALATIESSLTHLARLARPSQIFGEVKDLRGKPLDRAAYAVLVRVEEFGPIRLTDLALEMEVDISTASRHVRALEDRGLVERGNNPADQRVALLRLTPDGSEVLGRSRALRLEGIQRRLQTWDGPDLCALSKLLERFARSLAGPCIADAHAEASTEKEPPSV